MQGHSLVKVQWIMLTLAPNGWIFSTHFIDSRRMNDKVYLYRNGIQNDSECHAIYIKCKENYIKQRKKNNDIEIHVIDNAY